MFSLFLLFYHSYNCSTKPEFAECRAKRDLGRPLQSQAGSELLGHPENEQGDREMFNFKESNANKQLSLLSMK